MPKSRDSKKPSIDDVVLLFEEEEKKDKTVFSMDYKIIAEKLGTEPTVALDVILKMEEKNMLYRLAPGAEFMLNPKDMWKK